VSGSFVQYILTVEATGEPTFKNTPNARTLEIYTLQLENRAMRVFICCGHVSYNIICDLNTWIRIILIWLRPLKRKKEIRFSS